MSATELVTLVKNAIHNPSDPRHFMRVVPAKQTSVARIASQAIATSDTAVVVKEVGMDIYDAVTYFPRADVNMDLLTALDKSTHCPLKGDTEYFDLTIDGRTYSEAAWSYVKMIMGDELKDLIAFDTSQVEVA
jgi:uncharacterized protein (DUF427 family)